MTAELNEITKTSEAAIKKAGDKPDFSEAFKLLSNNTTAAEQNQERNAFNQVIQKKFPNLSLIGNDVYQDKDGKQSNGLVVFDKKTKDIELRQAENFSVVVKKEAMSAKIAQEKVKPEVAGEIFGETMDKAVELKAKALQAQAGQAPSPERAQPLRRVEESGEAPTAPAGSAAASAPGKIQESAEAAIKQNAASPDLSAVYKELSNNSTAEDQKRERTEVNAALQKQFPELSLVGQQLVTDQKSGKQFESLVVYDKETNHLQHRLAQDFSKVLSNEDVSAAVKAEGLKPETAGEAIAQSFDATLAKQPKAATAAAQSAVPEEQVKEFVYEAKPGDTLWHIAKTQIEAASPKDSVVSAASIKGYIEQIVARNKDQIKDADLIYAGSKYVLPELKLPEKKAEPSEAPAPGSLGRNPSATPGEQAPRPREIQRPVPPTARRSEPGPDLYSGSRNGAPAEAPAPPLKK